MQKENAKLVIESAVKTLDEAVTPVSNAVTSLNKLVREEASQTYKVTTDRELYLFAKGDNVYLSNRKPILVIPVQFTVRVTDP